MIAVAIAFACLAFPASAAAGTINLNGGEVDYTASDEEENSITVSGSTGHVTIRDAGKAVQILPFSEPGCTQDTPDTVTCPALAANIDANDLDDKVDASAALLAGSGSAGGVFVSGSSGNDELIGGGSVDTLDGDSGVDGIEGGAGDDFLTGGADNDSVSGGAGDDSLEASAFGTLGDDKLDGGSGDDTFLQPQRSPAGMSDGADTFQGGEGRDTADYQTSPGALTISLDGVANDGYTGEADNIGSDVENVIGGSGTDTIIGSGGDNTINGGGGSDIITAMDGDDVLDGGADASGDNLDGGPGDDSLTGGLGEDTLSAGDDNDVVDGGGDDDRETGGAGIDTMAGGTGDDDMDGGPGGDVMRGADAAGVGADGNDTIHGGAGPDQLNGETGNDTLEGGGSGDTIAGGEGEDTVDYRAQRGAVTVTIDGAADDGGRGEHDKVSPDVENVDGGNFNSTVTGNTVSNGLAGGSGEDYADGAAGSDSLTGGAAGDTLRSRDGIPDTVECGKGPDFAIADPQDQVKPDCEIVDRGKSRPVRGKKVVVRPAGTDLVKLPGVQRFVPLKDPVGLPVRSTLDPGATGVKLVAAAGGDAKQTGTFSGDAFLVKQTNGARATELRLTGPFDVTKCRARGGAAAAAKRPRRRLFGSAHGRFVTRGRYSSATVRGTRWSIEDTCKGTVTRVFQGSVRVRDFGRGRTVTVKPGRPYLARRGNR
jgi:Ca2+-binding RTX toxin-like protein